MWVQFVFFSPFVYPDISSSELFVPVHLSTLVLYISGIFYNVISFVAMQFTHFIVHTCILVRNKLERKKKKKSAPRVRPFHCTSVGLTLAITPNAGNSGA